MKNHEIEDQFTRVNSDVNGNPRYAIHFLNCEPAAWVNYDMTLHERYLKVCKLMNSIGGRKFHNKQYGGGIVFQSYSLPDTWGHIERVKNQIE